MTALSEYWPHITVLAVVEMAVLVIFIPSVLLSRKEPVSAVAWCLVVILMPLIGGLLFWTFGYNYLLRRVQHRRRQSPAAGLEKSPADGAEGILGNLTQLAVRVGAFPARPGNEVTLYHETTEAFAALLQAIAAAQDHVHLEFFIIR